MPFLPLTSTLAGPASGGAQARLDRLLASAADGFWEHHLPSHTAWYSESLRALLDFDVTETPLARRSVDARIHPADLARFFDQCRTAIETLRPFCHELRFRTRRGEWRWLRGRARVFAAADGKAEFICGAVADAHEQVLARKELERNRTQLEQLVAEHGARLEATRALADARRPGAEPASRTAHPHPLDLARLVAEAVRGVMPEAQLTLRNTAAHIELALLRMLAGAMQGTVSVRSALCAGSEFTVDVRMLRVAEPQPAGIGDHAPSAIERAEPNQSNRRSKRVLVVEDNPVNQIIAREMVLALGLEASMAGTGEEAVMRCQDDAPDLVLMDIRMPGIDGLETTRRLRALQAAGALRSFPIVALTAQALDSDRQASLAAGMDEHLTKPVRLDRLRQVLGQWLPLA